MSGADDEIIAEEDAAKASFGSSPDDSSDESFKEEGPSALKRLRERLTLAVKEKQEYLEGWQRARADFANYKKDEEAQHAQRGEYLKAQFVESLLPALDAAHLALSHAPSKDVELVYKQLLGSLKSAGVEQFGTEGEPFDPRRHEALREASADASEKDHTVEKVERPGYRIGEYIIRPAQVSVYVYKK